MVATKTHAMDVFEKYVYLAAGKSEYIRAIEKALQDDAPLLQKQRKEFARLHTWENCVQEIYKVLDTRLPVREETNAEEDISLI